MPKYLRLPVHLTEHEELTIHRQISEALVEIEEIETEKKRIKPLRERISMLNQTIETGTVERDVEVEDRQDPVTGKAVLWRVDRNEPVNTRALDPEERQLVIGERPGPAPTEELGAADATKAEEQTAAATPEEAEQLRDSRLAEEKATRAFDAMAIGDGIELFDGTEWKPATVEAKGEHNFTVGEHIYDVSNHGVSWRPAPTWQDVVAESQERERQSQIAALAADQADDEQKTSKRLLKAPPRKPRNKIVNEKDEPIVPPDETAPPAAEAQPEEIPTADLCLEDCVIEHEHTETRTAF
jgi:hypothetical protein